MAGRRHEDVLDAIFAWGYAEAELAGITLPNGPFHEVLVTVATDRKRGSCRVTLGSTPIEVWVQMDALAKSLHEEAEKTKKRVDLHDPSNE